MEVVNTVGRRKAAVARVFVKPGNGQITINHKELAAYFPLEILQFQVKQPLLATNTVESYDIAINLDGGGIKGQAEAARLGMSVRSPDSPEHVASSSSASVNRTHDRIFGKHGVGFQIGRTTYFIYVLPPGCRAAENLPGPEAPLPGGLK